MKNALQVLEFIDEYYSFVIARPAMYASSPRALEDIVLILERLRGFILEDSAAGDAFNNFTESLGFGSVSVCHELGVPEYQREEDLVGFQKVASVLHQFLESRSRLCGGVDPSKVNS